MLEIALVVAALAGVAVLVGFALSLVGLLLRLVLLPFTIGACLLKGVFGLVGGLVAAVLGLIVVLVVIPAAVLLLLAPLLLPVAVIVLIVHLARRRPAVT